MRFVIFIEILKSAIFVTDPEVVDFHSRPMGPFIPIRKPAEIPIPDKPVTFAILHSEAFFPPLMYSNSISLNYLLLRSFSFIGAPKVIAYKDSRVFYFLVSPYKVSEVFYLPQVESVETSHNESVENSPKKYF